MEAGTTCMTPFASFLEEGNSNEPTTTDAQNLIGALSPFRVTPTLTEVLISSKPQVTQSGSGYSATTPAARLKNIK